MRKISSKAEIRARFPNFLSGVPIYEMGCFLNLAKPVSTSHVRRHQQSIRTEHKHKPDVSTATKMTVLLVGTGPMPLFLFFSQSVFL